jgi:hypothetical protein
MFPFQRSYWLTSYALGILQIYILRLRVFFVNLITAWVTQHTWMHHPKNLVLDFLNENLKVGKLRIFLPPLLPAPERPLKKISSSCFLQPTYLPSHIYPPTSFLPPSPLPTPIPHPLSRPLATSIVLSPSLVNFCSSFPFCYYFIAFGSHSWCS